MFPFSTSILARIFFLSRDRHSFVSSRMAQREWGCCVLAVNDYAFTNVRRAGKNCLLVRIWVQKSTVVTRQGFAINIIDFRYIQPGQDFVAIVMLRTMLDYIFVGEELVIRVGCL